MQSCKSDLLLVALLIMTHPLHLVHCIKVKACIARFTITLIARDSGHQHQVHESDVRQGTWLGEEWQEPIPKLHIVCLHPDNLAKGILIELKCLKQQFLTCVAAPSMTHVSTLQHCWPRTPPPIFKTPPPIFEIFTLIFPPSHFHAHLHPSLLDPLGFLGSSHLDHLGNLPPICSILTFIPPI